MGALQHAIEEAESETAKAVLERPRCSGCGTALVLVVSMRTGKCPACRALPPAAKPAQLPAPRLAPKPRPEPDPAPQPAAPAALPVVASVTTPEPEDEGAVADGDAPAEVAAPADEEEARPSKASPTKYTAELGRKLAALAGSAPTLAEACRRLDLDPRAVSAVLAARGGKVGSTGEFTAEVRRGWPKGGHRPPAAEELLSVARDQVAAWRGRAQAAEARLLEASRANERLGLALTQRQAAEDQGGAEASMKALEVVADFLGYFPDLRDAPPPLSDVLAWSRDRAAGRTRCSRPQAEVATKPDGRSARERQVGVCYCCMVHIDSGDASRAVYCEDCHAALAATGEPHPGEVVDRREELNVVPPDGWLEDWEIQQLEANGVEE